MNVISDTKEEKLKKARKIYNEAMAKLAILQKDYKSVLAGAKKRITDEKLSQIRDCLK